MFIPILGEMIPFDSVIFFEDGLVATTNYIVIVRGFQLLPDLGSCCKELDRNIVLDFQQVVMENCHSKLSRCMNRVRGRLSEDVERKRIGMEVQCQVYCSNGDIAYMSSKR